MKQPNRVKAALREGRVARGYNLTFPSPHIIAILVLAFTVPYIILKVRWADKNIGVDAGEDGDTRSAARRKRDRQRQHATA